MTQTLGRARGFMAGFTNGQRAVVIVGVLALAMGAFALSRWVSQPSWTPIYGNLSGSDANAVVEQLTADGVKYKLTDGGSTILVPQSQVYAERIALSGKGLPAGDNGDGWSLLDKQGITATDFQQNVAYQRALDGELAKTLEAMNGVNAAVVHLAIPKKDVFATEQDKTTASVLLSLAPGTTLSGEQIRSVTNLVSGSVQGLAVGDVTVTDQTGKMLSSPTQGAAGSAAAASETDAQTANYENRLSGAVQQVLDQVVGPGHSVVRVNAQLDFNNTDTTSKSYAAPSPTAPPLSQATVNEQFSGNGANTGGTLGQILPTPVVTGTSGGAYSRQQSTVNNSVDETVQRQQTAPGQVKRLTVAVVLDSKTAGALNPGQIQQIVANSVGLDPTRGDSVQVDQLPFDTTAAVAAQKELAQATRAAKTAQYIDLGKKAGLALIVVIVLIVLMRRRGKKDAALIDAQASDLPPGVGLLLNPGNGQIGPAALGAGPGGSQLAIAQEAVANGDKIRSDVAALIDNQPDDVAQLLQGWLTEGRS
jgi:flagellar M-ring protein FliF